MKLSLEPDLGARAIAPRENRIIGTTMPAVTLIDWLGWKVIGLRNRIEDQMWERRLGVRTIGKVMVHCHDAHYYGTFAYRSIFMILQRLNLTADDVFVDIGCGKGRVVCCAATHGIRHAIGVDIDGDLCRIARDNAKRLLNRQAPIDIIHAPAQECDYMQGTKFLLFNPFGERTLRQVASVIARSVRERRRPVQIAYVNPAHDHVFQENPAYECFDQWRWRPWGVLKFDVSFWRLG